MTAKKKDSEGRTFLYLGDMGAKLEQYATTDPRFTSRSETARHLLALGMKADRAERAKAIKNIPV